MADINELIGQLAVLTHKEVELVKLDIDEILNKKKEIELKKRIMKIMCENKAFEDVKKVMIEGIAEKADKPKQRGRKKKIEVVKVDSNTDDE
jgi:hypothetical protein